MTRSANKLSAIKVEGLRHRGRYGDGAGLWLNVTYSGSKSWVFRWTRKGHVREMGLGPYPAVSLANARKRAFEFRQMIADGCDPKVERDRLDGRTFGQAADEFFKSMQSRWTNPRTRDQWETTLKERCKPIRSRLVADIETSDILKILNTYWSKTPDSASRYRMRMEAVLDFAKVKGWREGDNPARWKGHLANILPKRDKSQQKHHPALPYSQLPAFMVSLKEREALASSALQLLILTASRTSEVLKATWSEIDFDEALWTIPAERMKMKKDHRIPLSTSAMDLLKELHGLKRSDHLFPGQKLGKPLSNIAMEMVLRRMKRKDITVHGFRSTFRDWCGDKTNFPREVAEAALAHKVGSEVEQAYRRSDALEKRRKLMQAWSDYCLGIEKGNVVNLHG